ncbi:MAG: DUF1080 domain-containing protein [Verrucomicrobia bacterium]|nr:DUF1080 domain-containing protein [Verrucomicrobiota bacterium]
MIRSTISKSYSPIICRVTGLTLALLAGAVLAAEPRHNELTAAEKIAGWKLLFDGKTTQGWRSFKKQTFPAQGWTVEDGCLKCIAGGHGGDIISLDTFDNFDLRWEWKLPPGANNGVKYFITEERASAIGHEYQMLDDALHPDGKAGAKHTTASFYDVLPPKEGKPLKPPGQWNTSRVLVQGNHVEHWLNGELVLVYELGSDEVKAGVAASKFKNVAGFGTHIKGHILLTEHQDEAWFRDVKIRELPAK